MEPVFESQTKTKLGSTEMGDGLPTVRTYINDFVGRKLDNFYIKIKILKRKFKRKLFKLKKKGKNFPRYKKISKRKS